MPTGRRWKGLPVPFFFQAASAEAFAEMEVRKDDVIMSSLTKGGTTWVHKVLHMLLHTEHDGGSNAALGTQGQTYVESVVPRRGAAPDPENPQGMNELREKMFGTWTLEEDLLGQPGPRLFSTHLYGSHLPAQLLSPSGQGRLVVVLRNLKDTMASLHFFRGEAKDGWLGNEHGPGSLARFIHPDCPNAYGSPFEFVRQNDEAIRALQGTGRVLVVYYEDMVRSLDAQVGRMADFLGVSLTSERQGEIVRAATFDAMRKAGGIAATTLRKGGVGDWRNYLGEAEWKRFDAAFDEKLAGVPLAEPLRYYQMVSVDGLPPPRAAQTLESDPRTWPSFVRKTLVDGRVVRDGLIAASNTTAGGFLRPPSEYCGVVEPPGTADAKHEAEAGRYHLFVSGVCPWASGVRATRHMLGLEDVISMEVADGQSGAGWVFLGGSTCPPFGNAAAGTAATTASTAAQAATGPPFYLHSVYQESDPLGTTRITVPILWDKKLRAIVSNDSWSIIKMLSTAFAPLGKPPCGGSVALTPPSMAAEMEAAHAKIYSSLLNGVYKAGVALVMSKPDVHAAAAAEVYQSLRGLDETLAAQRFLLGTATPTALDVRVTMTLLRFDIAYMHAFGLRGGEGGLLLRDATAAAPSDGGAAVPAPLGYPHIAAYVRDMYSFIKPTVDWSAFTQYYRWTKGHPTTSALPDVASVVASAEQPHNRVLLAPPACDPPPAKRAKQ